MVSFRYLKNHSALLSLIKKNETQTVKSRPVNILYIIRTLKIILSAAYYGVINWSLASIVFMHIYKRLWHKGSPVTIQFWCLFKRWGHRGLGDKWLIQSHRNTYLSMQRQKVGQSAPDIGHLPRVPFWWDLIVSVVTRPMSERHHCPPSVKSRSKVYQFTELDNFYYSEHSWLTL